jgi:hypothetical protein
MWSIIGSFLMWLLKKITGSGPSTDEKLGRAEQANADQAAVTKQATEARDVQDTVAAASDDSVGKLRDKWTKP